MLDHHGGNATEDVVVGQPVEEAVDGHRHVPGLHWAVVLKNYLKLNLTSNNHYIMKKLLAIS
jgi:hypothetical protein